MKLKKLLLLGTTILTMNCSFDYSQMQNWYYLEKSNIPVEIEHIENKNDAGNDIVHWVVDNISYKNYANGFKPAEETLRIREGNCANMALLELALNYEITDGKSKGDLVYCWHGGGLHYAARMNGKIEETDITQIYEEVPFDKIGDYIYYRQ